MKEAFGEIVGKEPKDVVISIAEAQDPDHAIENPKDLEEKLRSVQGSVAEDISNQSRHNVEGVSSIIDMEDT